VLAVERIKREGEGTEGSPEQPPDDVADGNTLAHYYVFKEIHDGMFLEKKADGHWGPSDTPIVLPTIFPFQKSDLSPDPSADFNAVLSQLLSSLQDCWSGTGILPNIGQMTRLKKEGVALIKDGIRPEFAWSSAQRNPE
jgi:Ferritin-like